MSAETKDTVAIRDWFARKGLALEVEEVDGEFWVALHGQSLSVRRYGRGQDPDAAIRRAEERYVDEQAPRDIRER